MIRLDILGILMTLLLIDIFNWKRVLMVIFLIDLLTITTSMFLKFSFSTYNIAGIFTYLETTNNFYHLANFFPFIIGILTSKYVGKNPTPVKMLLPWMHQKQWDILFYKYAFYNLFFQLTRFFLRS